jgi:hypothetical protein
MWLGGRIGTGTFSATPKVVLARRYVSAGWYTGTAVHTYSNIEVNNELNITDIVILKAYR